MVTLVRIALRLIEDALRWVVLLFRSTESVQAENLFLRRQLALYIERGVQPHRVDAATRISLALLARLFDWSGALVVVQPATMIRWHRAGWRLFWRMKSRPGQPAIPIELRELIRRMARENVLWGEERIANDCCSSWEFGSRREQCASTCPSDLPDDLAATCAGRRS
jgi:putative transposase